GLRKKFMKDPFNSAAVMHGLAHHPTADWALSGPLVRRLGPPCGRRYQGNASGLPRRAAAARVTVTIMSLSSRGASTADDPADSRTASFRAARSELSRRT